MSPAGGRESPAGTEASDRPQVDGNVQPRSGLAKGPDTWLPDWLVRNPLLAGWAWTGFWLFVAGLGTSVLALFLSAVELTLNVLQ